MRIRNSGIVLAAIGTVAFAAGQLALPNVASASSAAAKDRASHPPDYVPVNDGTPIRQDTVFRNMDYNGGPVMPTNTNYMVMWSPSGLGAYPDGFVSGVAQYFTDLQHDSGKDTNVDSVASQYQDLTGAFAQYQSTLGGVLLDTDPYPANQCPVGVTGPIGVVAVCNTDAQLQTELTQFVTANHLATDLSHEYYLLTPPLVESCFSNDPSIDYGGCSAGEPKPFRAYCAYHENTTLSPMLLYADDPFDATNTHCQDGNYPNGLVSDGEINGGLSHEHNESVTDPMPNDAWTNGAAGNDQGSEIGDQCNRIRGNPLGTAPNGSPYNQVINGHLYWYQEEWSNQTASCLQRLDPASARPHAMFSVTAGSGLTLNFDASGSGAPHGVAEYVWQFNDVNSAPTVETTSKTISHTFPSAGAYSIGLTIMENDGTSTGNGGIVTTGQNGVTPGFTFAPTHSRAGQPVTFSALGTVSAQPVITYMWEFGDGTTGSGQSPTHAYSHPGRYTVTLVMFSGVGSAFPGQGAGPVSQQSLTVT